MATQIGHVEKVRALCAGPRILCVGGVRAGSASKLTIFDHVQNKVLHSLDVPAHVLSLALAGERVAAAGSDGAVHVYHSGTGDLVRRIAAHQGPCTGVAASSDGDSIVTAGADGAVRVFSLASGHKTAEYLLSQRPLRAVAVDAAFEFLAAAGDDGVVRSVGRATGARRDMAGHDGPVHCLAFTADGRLVSGGDDCTVRIWYLVGAIESEVRGGDDAGNQGPVLTVLLSPGERIFAAGADGKIKVFGLDDRRKPRTLSCGSKALYALAFAPPHSPAAKKAGTGAVFAGGDARTIWRFALDLEGAPQEGDKTTVYEHFLDAMAAAQKGARPVRQAAIGSLAELDEPEALEMLLTALGQEREPELRILIASELGQRGRRDARAGLRERLDDDHAGVRRAALAALRAIDGQQSLLPPRAALSSRYPDLRCEALLALLPLREQSPLVPGLIASRLTDGDAGVRLVALDQLVRLYPEGSTEPLRIAYERGPADLKGEVLIRAAFAGLCTAPDLQPILSRALDDADAEVRRIAFAIQVLGRPALMAVLEARDEDFARTVQEIARRGAQRSRGPQLQDKPVSDEDVQAARRALLHILGVLAQRRARSDSAALGEEDLEPLLLAMSCRNPHTALRGARGLAKLGDERALGALLQLSRETDATLRREAATALKELQDPRAKKRLLWMLDDADAAVRATALDAYADLLERGGEGPLVVAEAALRSAREDIRVRGLDRLMKLPAKGPRPEPAETLLGDAIEDESQKVRGEAFRTLWAWHEKDPVPVIDRALSARFPDVRLRAVTELASRAKDESQTWARDRLKQSIADRDAEVALSAYEAAVKLLGEKDPEPNLLALPSIHAGVRQKGARGLARVSPLPEAGRTALIKLLADEDLAVRTAALETLDKLLSGDAGPHINALQGPHLDLRVRAAELLAIRHDERLIEAMQTLLSDKELCKRIPPEVLRPLRARAASALATLGSPRMVKYLATELLKDEAAEVREQAARGLANSARRGDEGYLLDALGHADAWVRSWAADGLSRLGDVRALPVLTGNLRHDHLPIRLGAILSFAALGPEGYGGMLQGLDDPSREVQEIIFAIVLARDLQAFRRSLAPDLLVSALSSQRPDVRFAAARALELRIDPETYLGHVIDVLMPPRPEKAADMKDWPAEQSRGRILLGLAEALSGDLPDQRYAAAQVLNIRRKPLEYFREAQRLGKPRSLHAPVVPDTTPRAAEPTDTKPEKGWLRRLFSGDGGRGEEGTRAQPEVRSEARVSPEDRAHLLRLAFGAYVGLLRQVAAGDDEGHRVRRDAVDRIVELGQVPEVGRSAAVPAVLRALDDPHHLVRKAAFAGLRRLFPEGSDEPLSLALAAIAADVARAALDEFAARGAGARQRIAAALSSPLPEVRRYAFELLERLSDRGSLEPLLWALSSDYADLRIGVIERLATQSDPRVTTALCRAMESDHDDLRLRAAELLAERKDDRAADVLGAFLRADDQGQVRRALAALTRLGSPGAVRALAARLEEVKEAERVPLIEALGETGNPAALDPILPGLTDETIGETGEVRRAAFTAGLELARRAAPPRKRDPRDVYRTDHDEREDRDQALSLRLLRAAVGARDAQVRLLAAQELDVGTDPAADALLVPLFGDRDRDVRVAAVERYACRVMKKGADVVPLEEVLRGGARDLMLAAAEAVASRGLPSALRPLLLFVRAGEEGERERALLALGSLGDARALDEIEQVAAGGTEEAPVEVSMQAAAMEALGRLAVKLKDPEDRRRVIDKVEEAAAAAQEEQVQDAAVRGLRYIGGERSRARLEAILADRSVSDAVRKTAAEQLGRLGDAEAEKALAQALSDYDDDVRTEARRALDRLFPADRTRVEFLAIDSEHEDISQPAAAYLATEGDAAQLVPRLATLKDEDLRQRLRYGLLRRAAVPVPAFVKLLGEKEASARSEAAWLLGARAGTAPPSREESASLSAALAQAEGQAARNWNKLRGEEREAEEQAWTRILWAGAAVGAQELVSRCREILRAGENASPAPVRQEAVRALTRGGSEADEQLLSAALRDSDAGVRVAAAAALAQLLPAQAAQLAAQIDPFDPVAFRATAPAGAAPHLLSSSPGRRLLLPALLGNEEVGPLLKLARDAGDAEARLSAIAALGRAGGAEAVSLLKSLAFDKKGGDQALRKAAYRALKRALRKAQKQKKFQAQAPGAV